MLFTSAMTQAPPHASHRETWPAIQMGLKCRCPACGEAPLFERFLKPYVACPTCQQHWHHHQADDFPAYLVIFIVGHIMVPLVILANQMFQLSTGLQMLLWPGLTALFALGLLQPVKGGVIAYQWARQMHGFRMQSDIRDNDITPDQE